MKEFIIVIYIFFIFVRSGWSQILFSEIRRHKVLQLVDSYLF